TGRCKRAGCVRRSRPSCRPTGQSTSVATSGRHIGFPGNGAIGAATVAAAAPPSGPDGDPRPASLRLREAQTRLFYGAIPGQLVAIVVGGFLVFMLWGVVSPAVLTAWFGAQLLLTAFRLWTFFAFRRTSDPAHPRWLR